MSLRSALTRNRATTHPDATEARLRGRRYALPFAAVWDAALATAHARPRWRVVQALPQSGEIRAEARTLIWRLTGDVTIRVSLDPLGMTRVDLESVSRVGPADFGVNARRIVRYLRALDRRLAQRESR